MWSIYKMEIGYMWSKYRMEIMRMEHARWPLMRILAGHL